MDMCYETDDELDDEEYDEFGQEANAFCDDGGDTDSEDDSDQQTDSKQTEDGKNQNAAMHSTHSPAHEKLQISSKLAKLVPFHIQLEQTRVQMWANLKENLCEAIVAQGKQLEDWIFAFDE